MKKSILLLSLLLSTWAQAEPDTEKVAPANEPNLESTGFTAQEWTQGIHLLGGLGVNSAYFDSDLARRSLGVGFNIRTDVGYYFLNSWAVEASANVVLNRVNKTLVWDTLMTGGLRARLPTWVGPAHSTPYLRGMIGKGPSVYIYGNNRPKEFEELGGDRVHIEGDIYGVAYGFFENARNGSVWFMELGSTVQLYRQAEAIKEVKGVPEVVAEAPVRDHSAMYAVSLTFGVVLF